ncbi:MAG: hypothetical protein L3J57_12905, partial [Desulfuromusa sp.]|nr:hypothetical protein [Desulfuromusa sp.]
EANIVPNSSLLDELQATEIRKEAEERVLKRAAQEPDSRLGRALRNMIIHAAEDRFSEIISIALGHRNIFHKIHRQYGDEADPIGSHISQLERDLGLEPGLDLHSIGQQQAGTA